MRIAVITAGAAGMFCGSCLNDNTLVRALRELGHDAQLIPTYTPITTDGPDASSDKVFMGGIRIYLEQKYAWFGRVPRWMTSWLDSKPILRLAGKFAGSTDYASLGDLTLSLLAGESGPHLGEMSALVEYLAKDVKPELIHLSNALISGIIPLVQDRLKAPIVVELQGDDIFLDGLLPHHKTEAIEAIRANTARVARFHTPCSDYADYMSDYLGIDRSRFRVVPLGIDLAGYQNIPQNRPANHPPTIGFFARMCPEKGLDLLVDAWLKLRKRPGFEQVRLQVGGWLGGGNIPFWEAQLAKAKAAGMENGLVHRPCLALAEKSAFYSDCDLVSVPTKMREPKGLYLLEAWAHGKPVVQPEFGSFPELLGATGGGLLVPRENADELAEKIEQLLKDPTHAKHIGEKARKAVSESFTSKQMAQNTVKSYSELLATRS